MTAAVYAVANQKGGVAKTTTTVSLGAALVEQGLAVLAVDLDPQAALTFSLGYDAESLDATLHDVVVGRARIADTVLQHPEMDLVPAALDLAGAEATLLSRTGREYLLRTELEPLADTYDVVLVDCPPSLGVLTLNGLTAAHQVLIPVQCESLSHRGVSQLLELVLDVQRLTNRDLVVAGLVATMYDGRTRHARAVVEDVQRRYDLPLLGVPVRRSVRFAEAPLSGQSILAYDPSVPGAAAYRVIAAELTGAHLPAHVRAAAEVAP